MPPKPAHRRLYLREDGRFELNLDDTLIADLGPLRELPVEVLNIRRTQVRSLETLRGCPLGRALRELRLCGSPVQDLAAVQDCPNLELLDIGNTQVADLSPLHGMRIKRLYAGGAFLTNLAQLNGLPLETLFIDGCRSVTNVQPLVEFKLLREIMLPTWAQNVEALRALPNLARIGYNWKPDVGPDKTAQEFWADQVKSGGPK